MATGLRPLIVFYRSQVEEEIEEIKKQIIAKGEEFDSIRSIGELDEDQQNQLYSIGNRLLNISLDIVSKRHTLEGLQILEEVLLSKDPE